MIAEKMICLRTCPRKRESLKELAERVALVKTIKNKRRKLRYKYPVSKNTALERKIERMSYTAT